MNVFGDKIKLSIFGESHGAGIGIILDGLPVGETLDMDEILRQMARRAPGASALTTSRKEADAPEILSGLFDGHTTGAPLAAIIRNTDTRSKDYDPTHPRPGHADLAAYLKYGGFSDYRGGGHFSGRITAPLVFAGAVCAQILARWDVTVGAHIAAIHNVLDDRFKDPTAEQLTRLSHSPLPLLREDRRAEMETAILEARQAGNSVGGVIECCAVGVPAGLGSPFFGSMESRISAMMYAIPGVKGVSFGAGFDIAAMTGLEANDPIRTDGFNFSTTSNHSGGLNGGITNGMPVILQVAMRPTPSIHQEQETVDLNKMENTTLTIQGRHDPCIAIRAVPVVEAGLAVCLLDAALADA